MLSSEGGQCSLSFSLSLPPSLPPSFSLSLSSRRSLCCRDSTPSSSSLGSSDPPHSSPLPSTLPLVSQCRLPHVRDYAPRRSWPAVDRASTHFTRGGHDAVPLVAINVPLSPATVEWCRVAAGAVSHARIHGNSFALRTGATAAPTRRDDNNSRRVQIHNCSRRLAPHTARRTTYYSLARVLIGSSPSSPLRLGRESSSVKRLLGELARVCVLAKLE